MKTDVLFVQGGGKGAHDIDAALAASLQRALGDEYEVHFPRMPDEADPSLKAWQRTISAELSRLHGTVVLVGHSVGAAILLKYLSQEEVKQPIAGLFLLAAPALDEQWNFDDLKLPRDIAEKLASIPRIFFYHARDDAVVPFAHLALQEARFPQATVRAVDGGGHQFRDDLTDVARDIRSGSAA
jgi:predicted alpha/beta hydrolase family esterase